MALLFALIGQEWSTREQQRSSIRQHMVDLLQEVSEDFVELRGMTDGVAKELVRADVWLDFFSKNVEVDSSMEVWKDEVDRFLAQLGNICEHYGRRLTEVTNQFDMYNNSVKSPEDEAVRLEVARNRERLGSIVARATAIRSRSRFRLAQVGRERAGQIAVNQRIKQLESGFALVRRLRDALIVSILVSVFSLTRWPVSYDWLNLPIVTAEATFAACQVWHSVSWWNPPRTG
jgi:hypothetical protein